MSFLRHCYCSWCSFRWRCAAGPKRRRMRNNLRVERAVLYLT